MTSQDIETAFASHPAYEADGTAFALTTTPFDVRVTVDPEREGADATESDPDSGNDADTRYRVRVRVPTIDAAAQEAVDEAVADGWFDTFSLRLADASGVTRSDVDVPDPEVKRVGSEVVVTFAFAHANPERAATIAKTLAEYVEGTYAEGIVPGYTYESPVADLLARARAQGGGDRAASETAGDDQDDPDGDASDDGTRGPMPL